MWKLALNLPQNTKTPKHQKHEKKIILNDSRYFSIFIYDLCPKRNSN